jgi:hypothetical protein
MTDGIVDMESSDSLEERVERLWHESVRGLIHYRMWNRMGNSYENRENLQHYSFFFRYTLSAHLDAATLCLNRLFDKSGYSLYDLLQEARKDAHVFKNASESKVQEFVRKTEKHLEGESRLQRLRKQRNRHFVHLDSRDIPTTNKVYEEYPLQRSDILELLHLGHSILSEISGLLRDTEFFSEHPREGETEYVMELIDKAAEKRRNEMLS